MNRRNKNGLTWGLILISFGALFLLNNFGLIVWPLGIVALGIAFLLSAIINQIGGLSIPGSLLLGTGLLLFYQASNNAWENWLFTWPLITTSLGIGLVIGNVFGMGGKKIRRTGWLWLLSGVGLFVISWWWFFTNPETLSWAWIITGLGLQFLVVALLSRVSGLTIPGTILTSIGCLLYWQNATGNWESWSYVWPLVSMSIGFSFAVAYWVGLRSKALLIVGLYFVFISSVFFFVFGAFFAEDWPLLSYWPVILILLGGGLLMQGKQRLTV